MALSDIQLTAEADIIKNETGAAQNTATRVGIMLDDIISNKINNDKINVDPTLAGSSDIKVASQDALKGYVATAVSTKQDTLVSGTNIKTINGTTLLGSGNLVVGSGVSIYAAYINQTGTNAPFNSGIVKNDLSGTITFTRGSAGVYNCHNSLPEFTTNKILVILINGTNGTGTFGWAQIDTQNIQIVTRNSAGTVTDGIWDVGTFKIEIYS